MTREMPLPEHVFLAIKQSPSDWLWLVRLHPVGCDDDKKNQLRAVMQQYGISNFEIDHAVSSSLYDLLKRADHHVTLCSSVYYEALVFNVPTTIAHSHGLLCYEDEFKKGVLEYADTSEELLASVRRGFKNRDRVEPSDYIETSRACAERALKVVLNNS
jgi:CDP-glycerol glycerophosphotransferase (TagB/SpsB family)